MAGNTGSKVLLGGAAAAILVTGVLVLVQQDEEVGAADSAESGAAPELERLWQTPAAPAGTAFETYAPPVWATGDAVVAINGEGVTGYDPASGEERWTLPAPEGAEGPCAASPGVNGAGIGAILYRPAQAPDPDSCSVLAVVDTTSGELLWSEDLTTAEGYAYPSATVAPVSVGVETVSVELIEDGLHRFSLEGGEELPVPEVPGAGGRCDDYYTDWRHTPTRLVAVSACDEMGGVANQVTAFDADSGEELWTATDVMGENDEVSEVVSAEPLAIATDERVLAFGQNGSVTADLPLDRPDGYLDVETPGSFAVLGSALVTSPDDSGQEFVGINLASGEELWKETLEMAPEPIAAAGDHVATLYSDVPDGGTETYEHVGRLDFATGTHEVAGVLPGDAAGYPLALASEGSNVYVLREPDGDDGSMRIEAYRLPSAG
jgi:outer membrane protein assembly factor BamB